MCVIESEQEICGTCRFWDFLHYAAGGGDNLDCKRFPRYEEKGKFESCGEWKSRKEKQILHESKE